MTSSRIVDVGYEGFGKMIEGDFADRKISAQVDGGRARAEGLACTDLVARTPIGVCDIGLSKVRATSRAS